MGGLFAYRTYVTPPSPAPEETPDQTPSEEPVPQGQTGEAPEEGGIGTAPSPPSQPRIEEQNGQEYVLRMISYATIEGGVGNEEKILEAKHRIEGLPRPSPDDRGRAREANEKGLAYLKSGRVVEAVKAFQEAYQADQADVEVVNNLGYAYLLSGDVDLAEQYLLPALVLSPGRSVAWGNLGQTYAKKEMPGDAIACFANAYRFSDNRNQTCQLLQDLQEKDNDTRVREAAKQTLQLKFVECKKPKLPVASKPPLPFGWYEVVTPTVVRDQPTREGKIVARLGRSKKIKVVRIEGNWLKVQPTKGGNRPGYVWAKDVKPLVDVASAQAVSLPDILFASGRAELTAEGQMKVRQIANVLNGVALGRHVSVEGHTDSFERDAQALSEARARAVARALIAEGVSESRISKIRGYGSRYPIAPNTDRAGRANPAGQTKNRRVEVVIEN